MIDVQIADRVRSEGQQRRGFSQEPSHGRPCMADRLHGQRAVLAETPASPPKAIPVSEMRHRVIDVQIADR
ncbi:MAG: hypothetical protein Q8Q80_00680, partial [Methyloversatilis sp.]|uniref:hypothetical protein n=1 Tax=Methyloversatilis sp. TaxID=2569862 RepID=UPI002734CE41